MKHFVSPYIHRYGLNGIIVVSLLTTGVVCGVISERTLYHNESHQNLPEYIVPSIGIKIIYLNGTEFDIIPTLSNNGISGVKIENGEETFFVQEQDWLDSKGWPVEFRIDGDGDDELRYTVTDSRFNEPYVDSDGRHIIEERKSANPVE